MEKRSKIKATSRRKKRNSATIIIEVERKYAEQMEREVRKTVRNWNRLLNGKLGFKWIIIPEGESSSSEE